MTLAILYLLRLKIVKPRWGTGPGVFRRIWRSRVAGKTSERNRTGNPNYISFISEVQCGTTPAKFDYDMV